MVEDDKLQLDGEVLSEEDGDPGAGEPVRVLERRQEASLPALRGEVTTAAAVVVGGVLAGAATVAAVRAVGSPDTRRRLLSRRRRRDNIVASRSFLVDVHVLGR